MAQRMKAFNTQVGVAFPRYAESIRDGVERLARRWALDVRAEALRRAPMDTGRLRSSIFANISRTGAEVMAVVGTDCRHARFVEFGARRIRVGTPETPRTMWLTKQRKGPKYPNPSATMPYLRAAVLWRNLALLAELKRTGKESA